MTNYLKQSTSNQKICLLITHNSLQSFPYGLQRSLIKNKKVNIKFTTLPQQYWNSLFCNSELDMKHIIQMFLSDLHSWLITGFVSRVTRWMPLVEQELLILPDHPSSPQVFSGVRVTRSLVLYVMFCRSLFVLLYFFFWPLCCLSFSDLRILIAPLESSNYSRRNSKQETYFTV